MEQTLIIGSAHAAVKRRGRVAVLACVLAPPALFAASARAQDCALVVRHPAAPAPSPSAPAGPRIRAIRFTGQRIEASRLRRRMRMRTHSEAAWAFAHHRLCELYRDEGHVAASVGPPQVVRLAARKGTDEVTLVIPVREGPRYDVGTVGVEGVTPWAEGPPAAAVGLVPGERYRHARVRDGLESLRRSAGRRGHATWSAAITLSPRTPPGARPVVDVAVEVDEGPPWLVGRIAFRGARRTRDATLRRVVVLDEGALLDTDALDESVRRLESLGYVRVTDVAVAPRAGGPLADVTFTVEERFPFRYGLSGGVNALEGISLAAELGEVNALGRGERVFGSARVGQDVRAFEVSIAVPNVLGSPWTAGLEARKHRLDLEGVPEGGLPPHVRDEDRLALFAYRPWGRRSSLGFRYSLAEVDLASSAEAPPPGFGSRRDGRLGLFVGHDGWDHAWRPRRGLRADGQLRAWGGPLGGSVDAAEARARVFAVVPAGRRAALGAGAQAGVIRSGGQLSELPFDERYLLGGETHLRGFDARTVGPRDAAGTIVAGTRFLVLQAEAHADLTSGLRALAFADAGRVWARGATGDYRVSTGLEVRFELPLVRVPLRLIGALNPVRDPFHPRAAFRVAVGPAP